MPRTDVTLTISSEELDDRRLNSMVRAMVRSLRNEGITAVPASLPDTIPGSKGDPITLGAIAMALIGSGGVAVRLLQVLRVYLERKSTLRFEITRGDGRKVSLDASWFGKAQWEQTQGIVTKLLAE